MQVNAFLSIIRVQSDKEEAYERATRDVGRTMASAP